MGAAHGVQIQEHEGRWDVPNLFLYPEYKVEKVSMSNGITFPVYVNPNYRELTKILYSSKYQDVRGLYDDDNDFYFWDANHLTHISLAKELGIHHDGSKRLTVKERGRGNDRDGKIMIWYSWSMKDEYLVQPWIQANVDVNANTETAALKLGKFIRAAMYIKKGVGSNDTHRRTRRMAAHRHTGP